ncbi:MAG: LegC family aminotransferase [Ferruginibacter sp.]|nr:LegC family aminotransferase [Ferruginibacter sp.]
MVLLSGPNMAGNEIKYVTDCLETGWVSSVGKYVTQFEEMTAQFAGTKYAVATSCGTTALHICLILQKVTAQDLIIAPNITFIASINSIKYMGANVALIDVDKDTWQLDLDLLQEFLETETEQRNNICYHKKTNKRIPVIMPVHVLGNMCDMDRLLALAKKHNIIIIEDSTEALGSYYKGKHAGSFGLMGTFSYNGNKIITTGGGGMIVTNDEELAKKAKHLTTQAKSDAFEYVHDEIGYNYRLVNVAAAMGVAQMEQLPGFINKKKEITEFYKNAFSKVADIEFQKLTEHVLPNNWLPTISTTKQKQILKALNDAGLQSRPFWVPMNKLPMFVNEIYFTHNDLSNKVYQNCLSLPCSTYITNEQLEQVAKTVLNNF